MATTTDVSYDKHTDDVENIVPEFGPSTKASDGGSSKMWTLPVMTSLGLTRREVVIGGCLVGLLVLVLVLSIVLGVLAAGQTGPTAVQVPCSDAGCLQATSQLLQNLNSSARPCDDFYSYACGGWMLTHPISPSDLERTVHQDIYNQNAEKIRRLLDTPIAFSDTLADQKVKTFYKACVDEFENTKRRGGPLLGVIQKLDGWYVLGNQPGSADTWDRNTALKSVQLDYWVTTWFRTYMNRDFDDPKQIIVQIDQAGLTLPASCYLTPDFANCAQRLDAYRNYMKTVAVLLARDYDVNDTQVISRILTFVEDIIDFETMLANITRSAQRPPSPAQRDNKISLSELGSQAQMNWVDFFQHLFPSASVSGDFQVVLYEKDYVQKVAQYIFSFGPKLRKYHNYLMWRLIQTYVLELSSDYVHAYRIFYEAVTGRSEFPEKWKLCFEMTHQRLRWALSSLYVRDHFADDSKDKAEEVAVRIKRVTTDSISKLGWMDTATQAKAASKIQALVDQIGYPDWLMNAEKMGLYYSGLDVNASDHFGNAINTALFERNLWDRRLSNQVLRTEWDIDVYGIIAHYLVHWNELLFPAGLLQFPVFESTMPRWMVYGAMGSILGREIINSVDEFGGRFDGRGQLKDWWSNKTKQDYSQQRACVSDFWSGFSINVFDTEVPIIGTRVAQTLIAELGGVRQAFYAYRDWVQEAGEEQMISSLGITADQAFFIAYAQTNCAVNTPAADYRWVSGFNVPQNLRVQGTLAHLQEFQATFQCQAGDRMFQQDRCDVF
ncbi:endothelin-converting enzyme 1-like [Branchiostoma floridae]|uniref:Endothelin-converting enzyme 1-like n=1 Tax=Branchiostoma floridae TaxID=7739 RepID=A0A9J7M0I2_BRAFL|nr:endothelin-converting enzyme 1-like [Branchiostoma floridae]